MKERIKGLNECKLNEDNLISAGTNKFKLINYKDELHLEFFKDDSLEISGEYNNKPFIFT